MITIIDYGVGNLISIQNMFKKSGNYSIITNSIEQINIASKLVLPGIGAFDNCMEKLEASGIRNELESKVLVEKTPILGICVGLQMFMDSSEEGKLKGLGWIDGKVVAFKKNKMHEKHKIPNMGWLEIKSQKPSLLLSNLDEAIFYFAHSYHVEIDNPEDELITSHYGYKFTVGIERENIIGVQFHPEKSHRYGMQLLKNFSEL